MPNLIFACTEKFIILVSRKSVCFQVSFCIIFIFVFKKITKTMKTIEQSRLCTCCERQFEIYIYFPVFKIYRRDFISAFQPPRSPQVQIPALPRFEFCYVFLSRPGFQFLQGQEKLLTTSNSGGRYTVCDGLVSVQGE